MGCEEAVCRLNGAEVYRYVMPGICSNMYMICEAGEALVVDPHRSEEALSRLGLLGIGRVTVLLTHEHIDHISGVCVLRQRFDTRVVCTDTCALRCGNPEENLAAYWSLLHEGKLPELSTIAKDSVSGADLAWTTDDCFHGQLEMTWQGHSLVLRQAPGHSPGGMLVFMENGYVFTGDNLVNGSGTICYFPGGDKRAYLEQTKPLIESLADDVMVFPGHGEPGRMSELRSYSVLKKRRAAI